VCVKERAEEMEGPNTGKRRLLEAASTVDVLANQSAAFASSRVAPQHLQRRLSSTGAKLGGKGGGGAHVDEVSASEEMASLAAGEEYSTEEGALRPHHTQHEMTRSTKTYFC